MGCASSQQSSPPLNSNKNSNKNPNINSHRDSNSVEFGSRNSIPETASAPSFETNLTDGCTNTHPINAQSDSKPASDPQQSLDVRGSSTSEQLQIELSTEKGTTEENSYLQTTTERESEKSDQIQDSSTKVQSEMAANDNVVADDSRPSGPAQSNELAMKMLKDSPHLKKEFDNIDEFVKEMKEDPLLNKGMYSDPSVLAHFDYGEESEIDRGKLGDYFSLTEGGFLMYSLYKNLLSSLGISSMVEISEQMTDQNTECVQKLSRLRLIVWYNTTFSLIFAEVVCGSGMLEHFVKDLEILKVNDVNTERTDLKYILESAIYILYNCSRSPSNRQQLRSYGTVNTLLPFLKCQSKVVKLQTLFGLANLVTEEENQVLLADSNIFDVLFDILKTAWQQETHHFGGWTVDELVAGMTGLAKNDSNKSVLSEKQVVPILIEVMKDGSEKEQEHAVKCIWELSFDAKNRQAFFKNKDLMDLLKFLKTPTEKAKAAEGALWTIEEITRQPSIPTATLLEERSGGLIPSEKATVLISYHWDYQKLALKMRDSLRQDGYKVLIDVDVVSGTTLLEAMAEAVENSDVVLVLMSEKYKSSPNCRTEAEYSFTLGKTMLPVLVQADYKPDGWLGIMLGHAGSYVDFTGKRPFEESMKTLRMDVDSGAKKRADHE